MNAIDTIEKLTNTKLNNNLKYCLVTETKLPKKIDGSMAKPNDTNDFVSLVELLQCNDLDNYAGVGVSIQASNICAIDVDHCFKIKNDVNSIDNRGKEILEKFKDIAYCEFSFSGTGLRILFNSDIIENYSTMYYIKNEKNQIEYYQPTQSYRYVTLTGNSIYDNELRHIEQNVLIDFLDKYMKKPERKKYETKTKDDRDINVLMNKVKYLYFKNDRFQYLWFTRAPGSNSDESERDYELIARMFEEVTQDKDKLKSIFESSPYFKSKDWKHKRKWENQDGRYYNYIYEQIRRSH